jgi:hypothetical protein
LLDHETKASDQVPLLLSMKEDKLALLKAVDSGDTNLGKFRAISSSFPLYANHTAPSVM